MQCAAFSIHLSVNVLNGCVLENTFQTHLQATNISFNLLCSIRYKASHVLVLFFLYFPSADPLLLCLNPPSFYLLFLPPLSGFHLQLTDSLGLNCDSPLSPLLFLLPSSSLYSSSSGSGGPSPGTAPWCEG